MIYINIEFKPSMKINVEKVIEKKEIINISPEYTVGALKVLIS